MRAVEAPSTQALRGWQRRALVKYLAAKPRDFLAVATPGAGKTTFALRIVAELLGDGTVETRHRSSSRPNTSRPSGRRPPARVGIALDPKFSNSNAQTSDEYHGVVVTYAQVASHPTRHRVRTENRKTLVVFDEIHHGGDAKSWGDAIREAFDDATRRLALTGTPFRSDDSAIPFVTYEPGPDGFARSQADHTYGYADALADGVVRPVMFMAYSGEARWRDSAGEEHAARLGEPLTAEQTARAWKTALNPAGEWMPAVIAAADTRLRGLREHVPDAGGMIIASDQTAARAYAELLAKITGEAPTVVLSDDPGSSERISAFSDGNLTAGWWRCAWCPRASTCRGWRSASTPPARRRRCSSPRRSAGSCAPAGPARPPASSCRRCPTCCCWPARWRRSATTCWASRTARPSRTRSMPNSPRSSATNRATQENGIEYLGADAELDQVIFDGSSFGTATPAGSDEEADYLGIPGLLDAASMRDLLRRRQEEQLTKRTAAGDGAAAPPTASCASCAANSTPW